MKYQIEYVRDGALHLKQINRTGNICLFLGTWKNDPDVHVWEVYVLRTREPHHLSENKNPVVHLPSMNSWGKRAWTFQSLEAAEDKYDELVGRQVAKSTLKV